MNNIGFTEYEAWVIGSFDKSSQSDTEKRKVYLIQAFALDSIDTTFENDGYWFLMRWNEWAIFSIEHDAMVSISDLDSWELLFFGNITIGSIYLQDFQKDIMYVAVWWEEKEKDRYNIENIGILEDGKLDFIERIPSKCRLSMALVMIATKATFKLSGY